ncbi:MAG TPA: regulatory protein RecX [Dissulfurispiraceae bacterium]|nr:regulatory protein RecX [Dissulfurispiraceae bacterium]
MDDDFHKALQYAFLLLRYRDRSEKELLQRLGRKGFSEETSGKVLSYLKGKGYIDDVRFAQSLKRTAMEQRQFGKRGVINYLISKGIPSEIIDSLSGDDDDYIGTAVSLAERKMKHMKGLDEATMKRRLWGALARKGFSPDIIRRVMKLHIGEETEI